MNQLLLDKCMKNKSKNINEKLFLKKINTLFLFILIKQLFQ
jgi:hypothetical protein